MSANDHDSIGILEEFKIKENEHQLNEIESVKFASEVENIPYLTNRVEHMARRRVLEVAANIDRDNSIYLLNNILKNPQLAIKIEAGIFEFCLWDKYTKSISPSIYNDKLNSILMHIDPNSHIYSHELRNRIKSKQYDPQKLAFLSPQELHPEKWDDMIERRRIREEKKKNKATTDLYKCFKCGERKCVISPPVQIRSADEPMTTFITCIVCNNRFTK